RGWRPLSRAALRSGDPATVEVLLAEAVNTDLHIYPWTWIDQLTLEGPMERLQKLLVARLKAGRTNP
ncbi:MAG: hypothetical protein AAGG01_21775, partial [Planctomycetota bacterium]